MKATFNPAAKQKFTESHRKESDGFFMAVMVIDLAKPFLFDETKDYAHIAVEARFYRTNKTVSAVVNVLQLANDKFPMGLFIGSGAVRGFGDSRISCAFQKAAKNTGFTLSEPINKQGELAMHKAILAIAKSIGVKKPAIVTTKD